MEFDSTFAQGDPHTFIAGATGNGKTTLINRMTAKSKRIIRWNPMGDLGNNKSIQIDYSNAQEAFNRMSKRKTFDVCFNPTRGHNSYEFDRFIELVILLQENCPHVLDLVVDEASIFGRATPIEHPYAEVMTKGRHYNIRAINATQFPTNVRTTVRQNSAVTYIFSLGVEGPSYVATKFKSKEGGELLKNLEKHHALVFHQARLLDVGYKNPPKK